MTPREPAWDIVAGDVMEALALGRAVQETEVDASVRVHPWLKPGQAFAINRAELADLTVDPEAFRVIRGLGSPRGSDQL